MKKVGLADTTFSRFDYAPVVLGVLSESNPEVEIVRYTVPGIKDLPVACKRLFQEKCDIVIACGMVGKMPIDKQCSHEASIGLQSVQLSEAKHILEVFVHMDEAKNDKELASICEDRARKHAENVLMLLFDQKKLQGRAGTGRRQGKEDEGPLRLG
ncbi:MAG: riboflavin synthase [Candidatus Micrarchaeota archaeon]|nr:riboflavin synthase [Candidatus Micrarchaeota archaeon]MDE1849603.1 riboflavin synthase [Candidatus Micrarchaeota archaeon]